MFDFRDIEDVQLIVESGGFRAAAQRHSLSQSALSGRIAALEKKLGAALFDRTRRGARLTFLGRRFVEEGARLLRHRDELMAELAATDGLVGTVRIGVSETVVHTVLGQIMTTLQARHPHMRFELDVDVSDRLAQRLIDDQLDMAILLSDAVPADAYAEALDPIAMGWYARADDPLFKQGVVTRAELRDRSVVTFPRGTAPYRRVERLLSGEDGPLPLLHGSAALSTSLHLIVEGTAIGVLPCRIVENAEHAEPPRVALLDVEPSLHPGSLEFSVVWFRGRGRHVGELLRDALPNRGEC